MFPGSPFGGPQPIRPGQGMNPMAAMMGGLGLPPAPGQGPPQLGPGGLPFGGSMPDPGADTGGSDLLSALLGSGGGDQGDPYTQPPGAQPLDGMGTSDPKMGLQNFLSMLALAQSGVGEPGQGGPGGPLGGMMGQGGY